VQHVDLINQPRPMYFPASQDHGTGDTVRDWVLKTSADPAALACRCAPLFGRSIRRCRSRTFKQWRAAGVPLRRSSSTCCSSALRGLALVLAAVGLTVSLYAVAQRTRELGIRLALGAQPGDVLRIVLGQGARLVAIGLAIGTVASLALTRLMTTLLFGIGTRDPITFGGVFVLLAIVSLLACYIPARRAMRVDPVDALRI
jgi:predicted lysophospholipase L1 biosynthesis ABC-type transport system permease subunit